jgi:hypothetical protein
MLTNPQIVLLSECRAALQSVRHFVDAIQMRDECDPEEEDALREILRCVQASSSAFHAERGLYLTSLDVFTPYGVYEYSEPFEEHALDEHW